MRGKTEDEILAIRKHAIIEAEILLGEEVEVLETYFDDFSPFAPPLEYLARSIEFLSKADYVYFAHGWNETRGCRIEYECAVEYDIPILR